jgi:stage III sporulation protein AG
MLDKFLKDAKDTKKQKYLGLAIGIAILGIAITFIPTKKTPNTNMAQNAPISNVSKDALSYEEALEKRLTNILQKMEGVGQVNVMLTTFSNEEKVLAEEKTEDREHQEEKDEAGGVRITEKEGKQNKIVLQSGNTPFIIKENKPRIEGVLVLAEGADNSMVKTEIIESVSSLLNVPVHKVSVFKKQK